MNKILIITNKDDPHVDYVLPKMEGFGLVVHRLNTEDISNSFNISLVPGDSQKSHINFFINGILSLSEISGVWYRRPIQPKLDETQKKFRDVVKNEILHTFQGLYSNLEKDCLWVNYPFAVRQAENKIYQLRLANQMRFLTPKSCITQDPQIALDFIKNCSSGSIVKTLSGEVVTDDDGTTKAAYTHLLNKKDLDNLSEIKNCPTFFQEYITKDVELRITVIGAQAFAIAINTQADNEAQNDWRRGIISGKLAYSLYDLPEDVERFCIMLTKSLGLNFGAIDMIKNTRGEYVFLEINPNGQWLWLEIETGVEISKALINMFLKKSSDD